MKGTVEQTITINDTWKIVRLDVKNWQIQHLMPLESGKRKGELEWAEMGYFGTLRTAIIALPDKMLDDVANGTLTDVKNSLAGIRELMARFL